MIPLHKKMMATWAHYFLFSLLLLLLLLLPAFAQSKDGESYHEQLILRSLNRGQVGAYFTFRTFVPKTLEAAPYGGKNI